MRGDVIIGGLVKIVVALALVALVVFDTGAVVVNAVQLDEIAGDSLRAGRQTWTSSRSAAAVEAAVLEHLDEEQDVALDALDITADTLTLTVSRTSGTLVAHRIGPLDRFVHRTATKRAELP